MASRKEYEMLFQLQAQLGSNFSSTFKSAQNSIISMQKEIQSLNAVQTDITAYQKQQSAVEATQKKLYMLERQYNNIQREIEETEGFSSSLENALESKKEQIEKTSTALDTAKQRLESYGASLNKAGVDTNNLGSESERLSQRIEELKLKQEETARATAEAAEASENFGEKTAEAVSAAAEAIAAAGIAAAAAEIYDSYMTCVMAAAEFEETISTVEALSGASSDELEELSDMAKLLGTSTKYTATESAEAMTYMAMAGWSASEMLAGMDGVLQLAAASGEDLALVSDIVTDNLTAFGLAASDTGRFADILAAAATNSNTSVSIMGETFKNSASIAGALGYSVEDVAVAVGLMANSGVKGSLAGTALKNTFNGLLEGVTLTSDAFGEYEYSAVKADGTMKSFGDTINELRHYFEQMSEAERVNNAMTIAGSRSYNGLLAIINATDEDYTALTESINNCTGAASQMASIKMDNMNGQLTLMKSAWDAVTVSIGEQFTPTMGKGYELATKVFNELDEFINANPAVIKGLTVTAGALGAVTLGLTGYTAAVKLAAVANSLFTSTIPGVNIILGVSAGLAALAGTVVALNEALDDGIPSVKEATEAAREMEDAFAEASDSLNETAESSMATAAVAEMYIDALDRLGEGTEASNEHSQAYLNTLQLLCGTVPELADSIDLTTGAIEGGTAALRTQTAAWLENAKAQAYQEYMDSLLGEYNEVMVEAASNSVKLTQAQTKYNKAIESQHTAYTRMIELQTEARKKVAELYEAEGVLVDESYFLNDATTELGKEYVELSASLSTYDDEIAISKKEMETYQAAVEADEEALSETEQVVNDAQNAINELTSSIIDNTGAMTDSAVYASYVAEQEQMLATVIADTVTQMDELTAAYTEAYDAAYESVGGQYELWENAGKVVATSAGTINSALESQATYWQNYNANLELLAERTGDIEGLREVIASFADGSADSVNAIAGMAAASDDDLKAMVESWQTVQAAQIEASEAIAELKIDFTSQMDELQSELEADIEAMDLSSEAAESGKSTVQGYIDGATSLIPQIQTAYSKVATAAKRALIEAKISSNIESRMEIENAYATGTNSAERGFALVGENGPEIVYFNGGENILSAAETEAILSKNYADRASLALSVTSLAAMPAQKDSAFEAESGNGGNRAALINLSPVYNISGVTDVEELRTVLQEHDESLRNYILEVIETENIDSKRRAYV